MADEILKEGEVEKVEQDDFDEELEKVQKKTEAQIGFERRQSQKSHDEKDVENEEDLADKVANKLFPKLQAQNEAMVLEGKLEKRTTNPKLQELIKYHLKNTINANSGTLDERLELAEAVARKNSILKQASEINTATQNKKQIQNNSQGSGSATQSETKDKDFSPEQLADLEKRAKKLGIDPKSYLERMRTNMSKTR